MRSVFEVRATEDAIHLPTGPVDVVMAEVSEVPATVDRPSVAPVLFVVTVTVAPRAELNPRTVKGRVAPDGVPTVTEPTETVAA